MGDDARRKVWLMHTAAMRIEKLEATLREAIDCWEEGANYKGDYLREKHGDAEGIAQARAVLQGID